MPATAKRAVWDGILRGLKRTCPNCGEGKLFSGYLKVAPACTNCGHETGRYRADDGPAYVTMVLVGHVLIAPMLALEVVWQASPYVVVPSALLAVGAATLAALPFVKGGFIGLLWSSGANVTRQ